MSNTFLNAIDICLTFSVHSFRSLKNLSAKDSFSGISGLTLKKSIGFVSNFFLFKYVYYLFFFLYWFYFKILKHEIIDIDVEFMVNDCRDFVIHMFIIYILYVV